MKNFESHDPKKIDGIQLDLPLREATSQIQNNDNIKFDHISNDELLKIQVEKPEEYEEIMKEIDRQIAEIERQKEFNEIEEAASSAEAEENFNLEQERIKNLRESIDKALSDDDKAEDGPSYEYYGRFNNNKSKKSDSENRNHH